MQSGWLFFEVKSKLCAWLTLLRCDVEDDDDDYDKVPGTTIIEGKRRSQSWRESGRREKIKCSEYQRYTLNE